MPLVAAFLGSLLAAGCGDSRPPPISEGMTLEEKIEATRQHLSLSGAVVAVYEDGEPLVDRAFGVASIEDQVPLTTGHHFRVASLAKPFVATILLQLVDEGSLRLDDTVDQYLDGVPAGDRITLRMLAQHTSGLRNYIAIPDVKRDFADDPNRSWTDDELIARAFDFGPHFLPEDDGWLYSNTNYLLLAKIIEQVDDRPLADAIDDRICEPLGLQNTVYTIDPAMPEPFARGYQMGDADGPNFWVGEGDVPWDVTDASPTMWHGAGALVSTLDDVHRFIDALATGELVSASSHAEQLTWRDTGYPVDYRYGLGVVYYMGTVGHNGNVPGYQIMASHEPDLDTTVVVLTNLYSSPHYEEPANAIFFVIMRHLTGRSYAPPGWDGW